MSAFVGIGKMGLPMAGGLEGGDEDLVRVADALRRIASGSSPGDAGN